jgi:glycosyltransferase involved in cell wall biosynthesis
VVLINRNQAWNVSRLVESVLRETQPIADANVIFVDSASSDDSVAIASNYDIRVLRLKAGQPLTPAAGRYVGLQHAGSSRYVLFLDGDMELCAGWLLRAIMVLQANPDVAGVTGTVIDVPPNASSSQPTCASVPDGLPENVPFAGGASIYRRDVLTRVGPFNPYLHSDEEPELCLRIRHAGYRIVRLQWPIAYHYVQSSAALATMGARWRRHLYVGSGQIIRHLLGTNLLWPYLHERGYAVIPALALAVGAFALFCGFLTSDWSWLGLWILAALAFVAVDAWRKRSLAKPLGSLVHRLLIVVGTIRGFFIGAHEPATYPAAVDVIK